MAIARPVDRRLFFMFDRAHTRLSKAADAHLSQRTNIGTAQAAVLIYLGYHDNCRLSELAEGTGRNNPAITGLVGRMEKAGLVMRGQGTDDLRAKTVSLTGEGWALRETVMNDFRTFNEKLTTKLSEDEINAVLKFFTIASEMTPS